MSGNSTAGSPGHDRAWVTAAEWFAGGRRIWYDPGSARVLTEQEAAAAPGALQVFERVAAAGHDADAGWLTLLPGFPDGSYGWAQVDQILGHPAAAHPAGRPGDAGMAALAARIRHRLEASTHVLPQLQPPLERKEPP